MTGLDPVEDEPLDVLVVSVHGGVVHRWDCDLRSAGNTAGWTPANSGLDDHACPMCLPDGLPT